VADEADGESGAGGSGALPPTADGAGAILLLGAGLVPGGGGGGTVSSWPRDTPGSSGSISFCELIFFS